MAIDGMKVIDLDSHLVGDLESWEQTIEAQYKEFLPRKLPTKDNERRKTLVGNQIMACHTFNGMEIRSCRHIFFVSTALTNPA